MKIANILLLVLVISCSCNKDKLEIPKWVDTRNQDFEPIKGVSYVATRNEITATEMEPVKAVNANFIAVIPFALGTNGDPTLRFDDNHQWWGETVEGVRKTIEFAREQDQQIMIKPQIWFRGGLYTGNFELDNEKDWSEFEENYSRYIKKFAVIAEETNSEIFCIGTELETFIENRPKYWKDLIAELRTIYAGKLTYAANWDAYKRTWIWGDLDLIGIDAYFPLSDEKVVTKDSLVKGWKPWIKEMKQVSEQFDKKVLLAECGYRNVEFAGKKPWESDNDGRVENQNNQKILYQVMFEEVWSQSFVVGGFIWKWFPQHSQTGGVGDLGFTPQNKLAEEELRYQYSLVHTLDE